MKKRLLASLCLLLPLLAGCAYAAGHAADGDADTYALYFAAAELSAVQGGDAITQESVLMEELADQAPDQAAAALVQALLNGPSELTMQNTIPAGTQLLSVELAGSHATVDLSSPYSTLSGVALSMADCCLTMTLTQIPEITSVSVTVQGRELAYRDSHTFSSRDLLLSTSDDVVSTANVMLYFLNSDDVLIAESRTLELYEGETQASAVLKALRAGPADKAAHSALPSGFAVQSVWLEDDTYYVNLPSSALPDIPEDADIETALETLSRSLLSLRAGREVRFLVDGEYAQTYSSASLNHTYPGE